MNHDERNAELVELYLAGDSEAADELIMNNIGLVKATVDIVLRLWPGYRYLYDDLVGDGLLALTQAVRHLTAPPETSFKNLVIGAVRLALFKVFERRECRYTDTFSNIEINSEDPLLAVECGDFELLEWHEFFGAQCLTEQDREILRLNLEGYSLEETSTMLSAPRRSVYRAFAQLRQRIQEAVLQELT